MKIFNLISYSVLICYFGTITAQVPINGLAGYWPFNGNANDESGNENHGTTYGVSLSSDRFGKTDSAYIFDGIDDNIEIADDNSLDLDIAVAMSAWINFSSYPTYSDGHVWTSVKLNVL